jgi:hypothetical protein
MNPPFSHCAKAASAALLALVLLAAPALAQKTTGIGGCGTGQANCHVSEYKSYKVAPHNETLTKLYDDADKAKGYGLKLGIADIFKAGTSCMKCHSTVATGAGTAEDGVTCEGCHGPGADYKEPHQEGKGGGAARPGYVKSLKLGLRDLKNLDIRAQNCVSCHYVTDQKLLATGHKSGAEFNYVSGMRKVAKHWKREPTPDDLAKATFDRARNARGPATKIAVVEAPKSAAPAAPAAAQPAAQPALKGAARPAPVASAPAGDVPRPARTAPPPPPPPAAISEPAAVMGMESGMVPGLVLPPFPVLTDSMPVATQLLLIKKRLQLLYRSTK